MLQRIMETGKAMIGWRSIVLRGHRFRSPFMKALFDPEKEVNRKYPRQKIWDDPNHTYPPRTRPPVAVKGPRLLKKLEREEMERVKGLKSLKNDIRVGDVVQFGYFRSVISQKVLHMEGLVVRTSKMNSLSASVTILLNIYLCQCYFKLKIFSPLVPYIQVRKFGTGDHRSRLGYLEKLPSTPSQTKTPILSKASIKNRKHAELPVRIKSLKEFYTRKSNTDKKKEEKKQRASCKLIPTLKHSYH